MLLKKQYYLVFLFILLIHNGLQPQNIKIADSLIQQLLVQKNAIDSISVFNKIAWNIKNTYPDSSLYYANKAKELAEKEHFIPGLAEAYKNIGNIQDKKGYYILATSDYEKALQLYKQINDTVGIANSLSNLGNMASNRADYFKAVDYLMSALRLYEQKKDTVRIGSTYINLGIIYNRLLKYDKALGYFQQATTILLRKNSLSQLSACYINMGVVYRNQHEYQKSITFYKKALQIKIQLNEKTSESAIYSNIGGVFFDLNNLDSALIYFNKSLEIRKQISDNKNYESIFLSLAELYSRKGDDKQALYYLEQSEELIKINNSKHLMPELFKGFSDIYFNKHDFKKAFLYLQKEIKYNDSLNESKVEVKIADLEKQYEIDKREMQISTLKIENEYKNQQMNKKKQIIWLWIIISILFVAIAVFSQIAYRSNKIKNQKLQQQNEEIQKQHDIIANQKDKIRQELTDTVLKSEILQRENLQYKLEALKNQLNPHFLFNTFSTLISLINENQKLAENYARSLSNMYRYILKMHDVELTSINDELDFVNSYMFMVAIRFDNKVVLNTKVEEHLKAYTIPSFSLQLLTENAVKHNVISNKHPLEITIESTGNKLVVSNNLQPKKTSESSTGIGLSNIKARYKYLSEDNIEIINTESEFIVKLPIIFSIKNGINC